MWIARYRVVPPKSTVEEEENKKEEEKKYLLSSRCSRSQFFSRTRRWDISPCGEKDRGD
ncbi:hypothetical protein BHE74_00041990, partial [Ensete ventricosum]